MNYKLGYVVAAATVSIIALAFTFERPPIDSVQRGYRGTGMVELANPREGPALIAANKVPEAQPAQAPSGRKSSQEYQNVKVLGDLDSDEFLRLMAAITEWVSPEQGCTYCHKEGEELSADTLYTKVVSRRMLQMTLEINEKWRGHVGDTGVTCYTCHRGNPVPKHIWFADPGPAAAAGAAGWRAGQNIAAEAVGDTSLPYDPFSPYLLGAQAIRVSATTALPTGNKATIKGAEGTYGLMMHMSQALGVNCTYCHNTRSFSNWSSSPPSRVTAWHGIQMVRALNVDFLDPLKPTYPANRLGVTGDAPKANCTTCHQGAYKPLLGVSMLKDHPELGPAKK
jgi:photosynthetic reaction center cytochrome c subunit